MKNITTTPTSKELFRTLAILNSMDADLQDFFNVSFSSYQISFLGTYKDELISKYENLNFKFDSIFPIENGEIYKAEAYYDNLKIEISFAKTNK